ncbi:MAG: NgoMIV family type II restriction endonuclease [Chloroflexota bacterium]|nr:NgoMIV family type II restriction endonuclease [Chloroflexota bacterium]
MSVRQPELKTRDVIESERTYLEKLAALLAQDLDFHGQDSGYASHRFHSFPAKFPPQLPRKFIDGLTRPGDVVLDPIMGSGTTIVEAYLAGRRAAGFDIDPLALLVTRAKVTPLSAERVVHESNRVLCRAQSVEEYVIGFLKPYFDRDGEGIFALPELQDSIRDIHNEDQLDLLTTLIQGRRLRDISDLPFDLVV